MKHGHAHWLVWLTTFFAAVLSILPLPDVIAPGRPAWVPLVVIFWMLALPQYYGLFFAWIIGVLMDALHGTVFGQHAMAMLFMAMAVTQLHRRMKMYPWWQQSFMVVVIIGLYQLAILWIGNATGRLNPTLLYLLPAVTSALLWPWLAALFHSLRRRFIVI
ncbi:rod shape-determining protein MreD [Parendozoicomonas haliclonae]|uniref:Rod shape-determining protein MreD n=1 Tax=Parendozoicomonas haliclonae TaxID=1960125 RepID=A0A1X7AFY2_9GAMM|nr:rod shape-determining protein MreD [Parendozoicomonas haliclonae]SMA37365.1 Rod shape-determining protein MreD [Parendozoicomonas haliclonae]